MTTSVSGPFISLHNHTEIGSPLDGMNRIDEIFKRAKEVDHYGLAITDHGTLTAHYDCWKESKKTGVKFIPGIEIYFSNDLSDKKTNHMVLLAQNEVGYRNILRLNYEAYKNQIAGYMGKTTPRVSWEHISKFNEGVFCLTACSNGLIAKTLITEDNEKQALCYVDQLNTIFKDRFYLEIQPHALYAVGKTGKVVDQTKLNEAMIRISNDRNIPYVITCDAHYKDKDHAKYHDLMLAIKDKKSVDDPDRFRYGVQDMYLKTHEELIGFFGQDIASVGMKNSIDIAKACEIPTYLEPKGPILPRFPVKNEKTYHTFQGWKEKACPEIEDDVGYLRYKCISGFKDKFSDRTSDEKKEIWERVKKELSVIEMRDFSSYMLIVSDYINWAKEKGIPVGSGRGSAAGSMVAFLTGITTIDPIKHDLLFERFHNKEKKSFPDIDTDFSNPAAVKDYLKEKYGEDNVASISNWSTLSPKVIIKDVGRSLNIGGDKSAGFKITNHITSIMPDTDTIEEAIEQSSEFAKYMQKYPELCDNAKKLQGLTRNWSTHAAGVVISDRPLYEIIPLRIDDKTGLTITQWEKTRCEEFGLVKMDLLGLKTLTVMEECIALIADNYNEKIVIDDIPLDDKSVYKMISDGNTAGVFQLESTLTPLCKKIRPTDVEGIAAINALGRPSCKPETRETYINRELGIEEVEYPHPSLKRALSKTNGILLYEESAMFIAQDCAGWDLNEADALRKLSKLKGKDPQLALKTEAKFLQDCMSTINVPLSKAKVIWEDFILPLSGYSFNKSLLMDEKIGIIRNNQDIVLPIADVKKGDLVRSRNEKDQKDFYTEVIDNHYHGKLPVYKVELETGETVSCTMNHKFRTEDGQMLPLWKIIKDNLSVVTFLKKLNMPKIKSITYLGENDTYDLEVNTDDHQFYLANGILTSNSHSISYSYISVYTAWLKKHYPTEFMCALLNSEDQNGDGVQEYLTECKNMGIRILPPDVKTSKKNYTVTGDKTIATGLSAIKGVGDTAIDNIIDNRPYTSLASFFALTEARVVNKRVIESLAKVGAFLSFEHTRKDIFDNYKSYRTKVANRMSSLSDKMHVDLTTTDNIRKNLADIETISIIKSEEEWDKNEILLNEKDILGRCISGSLHEVFGSFFKTSSSMVTKLNEVSNKNVKSKVKIEVIVNNKIKEFLVKNGPNAGRKFAKYAIEDAFGNTSELTLWMSDYEKYKDMFKDGTPIKAICQVSEYMSSKTLSLVELERSL